MGAARTLDSTRRQSGHALAQLHRRVRQLRDRSLGALLFCFFFAFFALAATASAQDRLASLEQGLASDDARARAVAIAGYDALTASDVPAMRERMERLRRPPLEADEVTRIVTAFRHAVGSRRADDLVDVAPGVAIVLEMAHDRPTVRLAAAILIERAGERIDTGDSLALVPELMRFGGEGMRLEGRRITMRLDVRLARAAIVSAAHPDAQARAWASWSNERLGTAEPGRFVRALEPSLVPSVLRAYASAHVMSAVSVVGSFVGSDRRALRDASREALAAYGQSSIWVAREAYRLRAGQDASRDWGWRRTLDELFALLDRERAASAEPHLARAEEALDRGDRALAREALDAALAEIPAPDDDRAGAIALRLAEADLDASDAEAARRSIARADRLPLGEHARDRRDAMALFLRADAMLARGTLDADLYRAAATLDPTCARCVAAATPLIERASTGTARGTLPTWLAAAAFLIVAVLLWPSRREPISAGADRGADATQSWSGEPGTPVEIISAPETPAPSDDPSHSEAYPL